jgi:hypothetical protein
MSGGHGDLFILDGLGKAEAVRAQGLEGVHPTMSAMKGGSGMVAAAS